MLSQGEPRGAAVNCNMYQIFTARCYAMSSVRPSVCPPVRRPSVTFSYHDYIGWNTYKIRSVCRYGTVSVVENATGTVPYRYGTKYIIHESLAMSKGKRATALI